MKTEGDVYTPVLKDTGARLLIHDPIYEDGFQHGRGLGDKGIIRDPATGNRYRISGKSCDIETCQCDAWAEEISD